jgi:hypothetical protein
MEGYMKPNYPILFLTCVSLLWQAAPKLAADQPATRALRTPLSYAAADVLKLSQAGISENVIMNYVESSGLMYDLKPEHVIYLRNEGVADIVVNTMIDQQRKSQTTTQQPTTETPVAQTQPIVPPPVFSCPLNCGICGDYMESYDEPVSTLYVIPYPTPTPRSSSYSIQTYGSYSYYGPWNRAFRGPWLYRCGHWHGCGHHH